MTVFAWLVPLLGCGGTQAMPVFVRTNLAVERFSLDNGLNVVLHPDPTFRSVTVDMRYDVGSKHDPPGRTGLAHLVEHLTFRGKPDGKLDAFALLEQRGSRSHNATTTVDATSYYETVPSEELPIALFIEAARMARPLDGVDARSFEAERSVVMNERRQRRDNVSYGNLADYARFLLFEDQLEGRPTVGFAEDLERVTLEDAQTFTSFYYRPNNATLVIAGGFDPRRATALVHELFDAIPGAFLPKAASVGPPMDDRPIHQTIDAGTDAPAVALAWRVPPAGHRGWHEAVIAADMIGGWAKYRMGDAVRWISADVTSWTTDNALVVMAELGPKGKPDELVANIEQELEWLADSGNDNDLGSHKSRLIAERMLSLASLEKRAGELQACVARYDDANCVQSELHEWSAVRPRDLANFVEHFLQRGRRVRVDARPRAGAPKAGAWPKTGAHQ